MERKRRGRGEGEGERRYEREVRKCRWKTCRELIPFEF
jgi:hypothetical protein